jgi:hypothetical protein
MSILQELHDGEIAGSISWLYDGAWAISIWRVSVGKPVIRRATVGSEAEAERWLDAAAREFFPDSAYVRSHPLLN